MEAGNGELAARNGFEQGEIVVVAETAAGC